MCDEEVESCAATMYRGPAWLLPDEPEVNNSNYSNNRNREAQPETCNL